MKISDIKKSYGKFTLDIAQMEIRDPGIYGLIGPNGCGKTTLLKIIMGISKADSGNISYDGLSPRDITMVLRKPYLLRTTVINNLTYPLKIRGIKPDGALLDYYLVLAGLENHRNEYAPTLSGGEQQKLALVRAMIFSPKLVLIDEAFTHLDMESAEIFERFILERQRQNPIIFVICAHQLSHIKRLCAYVFFMYSGKLEAEGATAQILSQPETPQLQKFLRHV